MYAKITVQVRPLRGPTNTSYEFLVRRHYATGEYIVWNPLFMRGQAPTIDQALSASLANKGSVISWSPK